MSTEEVSADNIDFAIAAYREEGQWTVVALPAKAVVTAEGFVSSLRQLPGEGGVFGVVCISDDFFILAHTVRDGVRLMISDAIALLDWSIAREAAELIGLEWEEADVEEFEAAGDVSLCADFGLDEAELVMICQDEELYPDEQVRQIAKRLGFSKELATALRSR
ncbi:MAG: tRNA adenosine deaminase-associated protein [Actinobacteria bacterium]|nr:tRNA adenosine deaminase-associated protein [Actinomycetota bacterium]